MRENESVKQREKVCDRERVNQGRMDVERDIGDGRYTKAEMEREEGWDGQKQTKEGMEMI